MWAPSGAKPNICMPFCSGAPAVFTGMRPGRTWQRWCCDRKHVPPVIPTSLETEVCRGGVRLGGAGGGLWGWHVREAGSLVYCEVSGTQTGYWNWVQYQIRWARVYSLHSGWICSISILRYGSSSMPIWNRLPNLYLSHVLKYMQKVSSRDSSLDLFWVTLGCVQTAHKSDLNQIPFQIRFLSLIVHCFFFTFFFFFLCLF